MKKTLKFGDVAVNKKEFHTSKNPIALNFVDIDNIFKIWVWAFWNCVW